MGTYLSCPRKYQFQYIERPPKVRKLSAPMEMGRIAHDVLRRLYEVGSFGRLVSLEDALGQYDAAWEKLAGAPVEVPNENMAVQDYITSGRKMLSDYYERHKPFDEGKLLGVESTINFDLPGTLIPMQVKVDRLWKRPDGVVEIVDYKTGRYLPRGGTDEKFFDQMGLYQLGVQSTWPQFDKVELVQPFLALNEIIRYEATSEDIDVLTEKVRSTVMEIRNSERLSDFPTKESPQCSFCDYYNLCPAKRHERLLSEEEKTGAKEDSTIQSASKLASEYLRVDTEIKKLKVDLAALREDVIHTSRDLEVNRLVCAEGEVTVRSSVKEKFITKTEDANAFADLSFLARQYKLDDYFKLDSNALMKDVYSKKRLDNDQLLKLEEFVRIDDRPTVRVKLVQVDDETLES